MVVLSASFNRIMLLTNDGAGNFSFATRFAGLIAFTAFHWKVAAADFDRDGNADIAVANDVTTTISLLRNNGAGQFTRTTIATGATGIPNSVRAEYVQPNSDARCA